MINFAKRNLKVFFKDKSAVFFSLLSVLIIIGLYALFLSDVFATEMSDIPNARFLMDSWIVAGLLAVTSITSTMGAFGIMVDDRAKKIVKDFNSSPVTKREIAGGYILGAFAIGVIMSVVALVLTEIYIVANGGSFIGLNTLIKVLGLIILSTFSGTSMVLFIVSFFKSVNAFATASTIVGTLIGFLTGIYLPIGQLPDAVQLVVKVFPVSHSASLFRQTMMEAPLSQSFKGAPAGAIEEFENLMGVTFKFGETTVSWLASILVLLVTAVVFYGLSIINLSRKVKH